MSDYLLTYNNDAGGTFNIPLANARIRGVYCSAGTMTISWSFNGTVQKIVSGVSLYEPPDGFTPGPFSELIVNTTAACSIGVRVG